MKARIALAAGVAAFLAAALAFPSQAAFAATVNVDMVPGALNKGADAYSPNPVEVNVGDTVVWTNKDSTIHTNLSGNPTDGATGEFGGTANNPTIIPPNGTLEYTFTTEGEYDYYCNLHPAMVGVVNVVAGGGNGGNGEPTESTATAELDGESYEVMSMSADNALTGAEIAAGQSVTLTFDGAGAAEVTLPKSMISGNLMANGEMAEVVTEDDQSTTISVTVPDNGGVQLTGTTVVPEFGVIAALVLAASLVAVIGFARFKGTAFGFGRL
jgi:predicted secreted protein with PEFG-CTERM motif